ncbi:MAG: hypothetical protein ACYCQI_14065 [Gammaproteobacteria bacterium]
MQSSASPEKTLEYKNLTIPHSGSANIKDADAPVELVYKAIPLIIALQKPNPDEKEITFYYEQTKNIDTPDSLGKTALAYAVSNKRLVDYISFALLQKGADPGHPSVRAAFTTKPTTDPLLILYELQKPIAKLAMEERAKYQERIANHFIKLKSPDSEYWDLVAAQNGSSLAMLRIAKALAEKPAESSKLQAIFWFESQYLKWTDGANHTSIISSLIALADDKMTKIAFCACMALARIHIKQAEKIKERTNTAFNPTFAEEWYRKALSHPKYSTLPSELLLIEHSKMMAELLYDTKKKTAEYLYAAQLGDLFAAWQAVLIPQEDSQKAQELLLSAASQWEWEYFNEWSSDSSATILPRESKDISAEPSPKEHKHPSGKSPNDIKKALWNIQIDETKNNSEAANYVRTKLKTYFTSKDEKELIRQWLLEISNQYMIKCPGFFRTIIPIYFEEEPALIELRKELIILIKTIAQAKEGIAYKNIYADILTLERETSNKLLVKRGADRSEIIEKLIQTQSILAADEKKNFKPHIERFTAMLAEPQVKADEKLRYKISHIIAVLNFREYEANRHLSDKAKKDILRRLAENNVFFAISELDTLSKGRHLLTNQEFVGRHLFLAMKLILNTERGLADFPQQASLVNDLKEEKLAFLRGWACESITTKNREYVVMAQWYLLLLEKIIPSLKNSEKPLDKDMLVLLETDPDAFLLKSEGIYAKQHFDSLQLAIITRRCRQDMMKGLGDKSFVDTKDKVTLKSLEEEKKKTAEIKKMQIEREELKKQESRKRTKLEELSEEEQLAAVLKLSAEETSVKRPVHIPAPERKSPPIDREALNICKDLYLAVLTLLSDTPQQQERQQAEKLLEGWSKKTLSARDPHYKYYLTAHWYLLLIHFLLPNRTQEWRRQELSEVLKTALQDKESIADYLPPGSLEIISPCVLEAQQEFFQQKSPSMTSKVLYPMLPSAPPEPSVASSGVFASTSAKTKPNDTTQDDEPGLYPQFELVG